MPPLKLASPACRLDESGREFSQAVSPLNDVGLGLHGEGFLDAYDHRGKGGGVDVRGHADRKHETTLVAQRVGGVLSKLPAACAALACAGMYRHLLLLGL